MLETYAEKTTMPYTLLLRSDGGSDRNPRNRTVQLGLYYLWHILDLDSLIVMITAANISALNEVEGVMPLANFALQHQSHVRAQMSDEMERLFKNENSTLAIRNVISEAENTQVAQEAWRQSLKPTVDQIQHRFQHMQ